MLQWVVVEAVKEEEEEKVYPTPGFIGNFQFIVHFSVKQSLGTQGLTKYNMQFNI